MNYTPDEVAKLLANRPNQPHYIASLIAECVAAERERWLNWCNAEIIRHRKELDHTGYRRHKGAADALEAAVRQCGHNAQAHRPDPAR